MQVAKLNLSRNKVLSFLPLWLMIAACSQEYTPKPVGYFRFDLKEPAYKKSELKGYPYSFEHSVYAQVKADNHYLSEPYWIDIRYPGLKATVECTYKSLNGNKAEFNKLIEDVRKLVSKHQIKASGIDEGIIKTNSGRFAYLFELSGEVPTQFQFYYTDSTHHFFRGALYFNTATRNDSLAPVIRYISRDMVHLLKTFEWKK